MFGPFVDNPFMQRALFGGSLVAIACAIVGTFVVLRGLAFIGDALAHGVLPGVAVAMLLGVPVLLGAAVGAATMIGGVSLVRSRSRLSNDSAVGLLFIGLLSLGVVIVSASDSLSGRLESILFGEFLGVDAVDIVTAAVMVVVVAVIGVIAARPFVLSCFDPELTKVMGYNATFYEALLLVMVAATVVVSFQTVGTLLVFGLLLAPAGVGALVARRVSVMIAVASATGVLSTYLGLLASYHFGWAAGASVVLCAVGIFFATLSTVSLFRRVSLFRSVSWGR